MSGDQQATFERWSMYQRNEVDSQFTLSMEDDAGVQQPVADWATAVVEVTIITQHGILVLSSAGASPAVVLEPQVPALTGPTEITVTVTEAQSGAPAVGNYTIDVVTLAQPRLTYRYGLFEIVRTLPGLGTMVGWSVSELTAHIARTTTVHGIADTALLETAAGAAAKVAAHRAEADGTAHPGIDARLDVLEADDAGDDAAIALVQANLDAHLTDAVDSHDASAVSVLDTAGNYTGIDVEAVLAELPGAFAPLGTVGAPNDDRAPLIPDAIIETFQSGHGWTQFGTGTLADDTTDFVVRSQCLSMTTNGAGVQSKARKNGYTAVDFTGKAVRVTFKITNLVRLADFKLRIGDTSMTNFFQAPLYSYLLYQANPTDNYTATVREGEWITVVIPWSTFVVGSGSPTRSAITDFDLLLQDNSAGTVQVRVNEIAAVPAYQLSPSGGVVTFWFDDGYRSQYTVAKPKLDQYGWGATLPIIVDLVDSGASYVTLAQLQTMERSSNWEVCPHALTSARHSTTNAYVDLDLATCEADWDAQRLWLLNNGLGAGRDVYAYPKGRFTVGAGSMEQAARKHFAVARTIDNTRMDSGPPQNKYRVLAGGYAYNTTTLASLTALVDSCKASGGWLNFTFHNLTATPSASTDYLTSDFQTLVDYVAASGLPVMTASQAVRAMNGATADSRLRDGSYRSSLMSLQGLSGENFRHDLASGSSALVSGTVHYLLTPFTAGDVVRNLWFSCGTAGATLTLVKAGIYNRTSLAQLAVTADVKASFASAGNKSCALTTPWVCPATGYYYVAFLPVGTTAPAIVRSGNLVANAYRFGSNPANCASQASQSDLPSTAALTQDSFNSLYLWVGWS